jgi:hypothetical protein
MKAAVQIFLSYAREDEERVETLYQKLSDAGFKPWMYKKDILPGEQWKSRIPQAIRHSDFFLVCLSANSVDKRGWIQKEIKEALDTWQEMLDSDIYLIPVRLEDCRVPERLSDFQWVNLFEKDGWTRLVEAIRVGIERRAKATKPVAQKFTPFESHPVYKLSSHEVERKAPKKAKAIPKEEQIHRQREREPQKLQAPSETLSTPEAKTSPPDRLKAASQRQLSPWNPLDHLRLLWWMLVAPQGLKAYREAFGEKDERRVGKWLASNLTWLPLFIPTLALGLGTLPRMRDDPLSTAYLWISLGLTLAWAWALTGWLIESDYELVASILAFILAGVVAVGMVFGMAVYWEAGMAFGMTVVLAFVVAFSVAASMETGMAFFGVAAVAAGVVNGVAITMNEGGGIEIGITSFILILILSKLVGVGWSWSIGAGLISGLLVGGGTYFLTEKLATDTIFSSGLSILVAFVEVVVVFLVAGVVARVVAGVAARVVAGVVVFVVAGGVAIGEWVLVAILVAFGVAVGMAGVVAVGVGESLKTGYPSWLARAAFGALVLAYAFLVWFSFLGGWRVFQ